MVRIDSRRPRMVCLAVWFISGLQEPMLCLVHSQSSINTCWLSEWVPGSERNS